MLNDILVSVVTVCWNPGEKIISTIESVLNQSYKNIEYIIIDAKSTDETISIISKYINKIDMFISEEDSGIYNAMNKGISFCNGEIVGILNAGDSYELHTIEKLVNIYKLNNYNKAVYFGGINKINDTNIILNSFNSNHCDIESLKNKMSIFHTSTFISKSLYNKFGNYLESYKISSDFELLRRYYIQNVSFIDLKIITTNMLVGGVSDKFSSIFIISHEISLIKCNNSFSFKYYIYFFQIFLISSISFLKRKLLNKNNE